MHKIVLCALALFAVAAAQQAQDQVYVLKHDSEIAPDGYQFDFETSDGTSRQEKGTLKQLDADHQALEVTGSYKYVGPDGLTYTVTFTADENGYQPQEHVDQQ
ncbi:endocuticle structural glycoprotein ABD-5-like [Anticarsia gemmatalis]|uniref:endocuticle structural glycoprotein ABD-5-like n=1 Tax=Anticarsia gemmatalis TaxID=129554 RepID=UPI003F75A091